VSGSTRRRQLIALALSGIFPGLGQFYNHQPWKGGGFVVAGVVLSWLAGRAVPDDLLAMNPLGMALILPIGVLLIVWCWSLIDAWRGART
jgi:TM2 domain-containing membrane protein YozV